MRPAYFKPHLNVNYIYTKTHRCLKKQVNMNVIGIIPARYESSRFPGKPLALINGNSMIERVYRQACKALDNVLVATDDERIHNHVLSFGGKSVMTSKNHRSGTDRCYEAFLRSGTDANVVVNIQGDEPFVEPEQIRSLVSLFPTDIATLVSPFAPDSKFSDLSDPNLVKVVIDKSSGRALYFSRSVIPYMRGEEPDSWASKHTALPHSSLESSEALEQLRWLEYGHEIRVAHSHIQTIGIDTPDDLKRAQQYAKEHCL